MSGVTKHIFDQEVRDILSMWDCEIKTIQPLLPKEYSKSDIIALLKEFYPYEWRSVEVKYTYYQTKHRLTRAHREKQLKMSCQALHNAPPNRT